MDISSLYSLQPNRINTGSRNNASPVKINLIDKANSLTAPVMFTGISGLKIFFTEYLNRKSPVRSADKLINQAIDLLYKQGDYNMAIPKIEQALEHYGIGLKRASRNSGDLNPKSRFYLEKLYNSSKLLIYALEKRLSTEHGRDAMRTMKRISNLEYSAHKVALGIFPNHPRRLQSMSLDELYDYAEKSIWNQFYR